MIMIMIHHKTIQKSVSHMVGKMLRADFHFFFFFCLLQDQHANFV